MASVRLIAGMAAALAWSCAVLIASPQGAGQAQADPLAAPVDDGSGGGATPPSDRRAFFGELHLHTTMSFDAWTFGTKVTPDQAYRFARGETVMTPAVQVAREQGLPVNGDVPARRAWPLDFTAVTDHAEFLGAAHQLDDPDSAFAKTPVGQMFLKGGTKCIFWRCAVRQVTDPAGARRDMIAAQQAADGWALEMKAANDNYRPGKFTTLVAYEWTSRTGGATSHRNVIFNGDHAPPPFTAVESDKPEDLWAWLASVRARGIDVLAIPHNSNLSDGHDFDWNMSNGRPIDEAYAQLRALNEPLVEIAQTKGASETTPELSPTDEFANFEITDRLYRDEKEPNRHGSYVREAWGRGLIIQSKVGANPFKMGVVGASDIHNGLSASDEAAFAGGFSGLDPKTMTPAPVRARHVLGVGRGEEAEGLDEGSRNPLQASSAAITGVWAETNTRQAIFAALKRKETFATSGTRIRLRMFGGWGFDPKMTARPDWVARAYAEGAPMGSDLPARPCSATAPRFALQAMKDPDGANLDRIQVIKVWLKPDGTYGEKVFDAALSGGRKADAHGHAPAVGDTVDLATGTYKNTIGAPVLTAVWADPEFDPKTPAVYYARALEIPTPRWSTLLAIREKLPIPKNGPATLQERAWSSPIWFTPPGRRS
jgi:hypothetical protein